MESGLGHKSIKGAQGNFVSFQVEGKPDRFLNDFAKNNNILLRPFESLGKNWVRVSMDTAEEMDRLAAAMEELS